MAASIKATRMELLRLKKKKALAAKGHKLLKEKRDALISEFFKLVDDLESSMEKTQEKLSKAYKSIILSEAVSGYDEVRIAAESSPSSIDLKSTTRTIMGVKVPQFSVEKIEGSKKGYSMLSSSVELDGAADDFNEALETIIKLAELESTAELLAEEIKKTKRKVNSLERIVIPSIQSNIASISMRLEEMERENFARLKVIKANMAE